MVRPVATGTQIRCTHQGGEKAPSTISAPTTVSVPTMKMRKAAGPSPTLKLEKSSPHFTQRSANLIHPLNKVRAPQRGHEPASAS